MGASAGPDGEEGRSNRPVALRCQELDAAVERFRTRPLAGTCSPSRWWAAPCSKGRQPGRVVAHAVVSAMGRNAATGQRAVLGRDGGPSADGAFWLACLRGVVARGLAGVQRVTSDAPAGVKAASAAVLHGASGPRGRVPFVRNALALVPQSAAPRVAATLRTVFAQPEPQRARQQWRHVADGFRPRSSQLAALLDHAEADVVAYLAFPPQHGRQIGRNHPLERRNREGKRRTDVAGIFPHDAAILRLVGMVLAEQHDAGHVGRRSFSAESVAKRVPLAPALEAADALTRAAS